MVRDSSLITVLYCGTDLQTLCEGRGSDLGRRMEAWTKNEKLDGGSDPQPGLRMKSWIEDQILER